MINRNRNVTNYHVQYMDVMQHWDEHSEKFAGADALITALADGWNFSKEVEYEDYHFGGNREIRIYNIRLRRDNEEVMMPVIHNPYVTRLLASEQLRVRAASSA